jgi:glycosyltransferase involved in cell wall biosynthesis
VVVWRNAEVSAIGRTGYLCLNASRPLLSRAKLASCSMRGAMFDMANPLIDVLIPAYNAGDTLVEALASIQKQTVENIRIIIIDDGSTDATSEILADLRASDPRLEVVRRSNGGIVEALNEGLKLCRAEFIARHDADDIADPGRFAKQLCYLRGNGDCVAVSAFARRIDQSGRRLALTASPPPPHLADPAAVPAREPYLMHPLLMVRRAVLSDIGGYRHVFQSEDTDLYWRLQERGRVHNIPELLGSYRVHVGSSTNASVFAARLGAVTSQLSAISARRRRAGRPDLVFRPESLARYRSCGTLAGMIEIGEEGLQWDERRWLRLAAPAKLIELSGYRLFVPEIEDVEALRSAWQLGLADVTPEQRKSLSRLVVTGASRLALMGRFKEVIRLAPVGLLPFVMLRTLYRVVAPKVLRSKLREARKRTQRRRAEADLKV